MYITCVTSIVKKVIITIRPRLRIEFALRGFWLNGALNEKNTC
jgi:hypothetical protein